MEELKVCLAGASGSGKTTICKFLKEEFALPWYNGSSGAIKTPGDLEDLEARGMHANHGHKYVIQQSHTHPDVGWLNQSKILERRHELMVNIPGSFVTDRSPIDNIVYMLMQCGPYQPEARCNSFITKAYEYLNECCTHLIYTRPLNFVEDNGSRIPNLYYQQAVDAVFEMVIKRRPTMHIGTKILMLGDQDLLVRYARIRVFLSGTLKSKKDE